MAKVFGEAGRYVSLEAVRKRHRLFILAVAIIGLLGAFEGLVISSYIPVSSLPPAIRNIILFAGLFAIWVFSKWASRRMDDLEKERSAMLRGATGETMVAAILANLPENYCVINDLKTEAGNLDHVVVGSTGVFVIDTKNWRGVVSHDGKRELLLNGQPTEKPFVKQFVGRVMGIKDRVRALAPGVDPYFRGVFVFTSARVEAPWGKTGTVHCVRDEQLTDYILTNDFRTKLTPDDVKSIAQAFLGLAHMDTEFNARSSAASS